MNSNRGCDCFSACRSRNNEGVVKGSVRSIDTNLPHCGRGNLLLCPAKLPLQLAPAHLDERGPAMRIQSSSVFLNGNPRSPLNSFFSRRSLELLLRRMMPGATSWLLSRRARRPLSQSAQLMEPSIGMQGTFDFEFIGDFFYQLHALGKITVFRQVGKLSDLVPLIPISPRKPTKSSTSCSAKSNRLKIPLANRHF